MNTIDTFYSLGADLKEQQRLERQQRLYGDDHYLTFKEADTVCEIGCGAGANLWIAEKLTHGRYIGIDIQEKQIEACLAKAEQRSLTNTSFTLAQGEKIPIADHSVDAAFCRLVLIHVADPLAILREMCRIIKPGGRVIVIEPAVSSYFTTKQALLKCYRARIQYTYRPGHGSIDVAYHLDSLLHECGLKQISVTKHTIEADGRQKEKLADLLENWWLQIRTIGNLLVEQNLISLHELTQAEKEIAVMTETDTVYQELWIAEGRKESIIVEDKHEAK